jgi:DNA invertase Pin-like site-specific DNA recombinase
MREQAGIWQRVSTGGQDEASQLPDLVRWCQSHDYEQAKSYVLHGKSASKGKHQAALDEVIRDMQDGVITVLVVWQSSRIERRGAYSVFDLARRVRETGGRIEYVKDAYLNDTNEMSDVMLALAATKDRQKSRDISLQVTAKQAALREIGSAVGRAPWGYEIVKRDGIKIFAPTSDGRKCIPVIFRMLIDGSSLRDVAVWLDSQPVGHEQWNEYSLGNHLVKNPTYYGAPRNAGVAEGLVTYSVWQQANAALASRNRPGRSTVANDKALLAPVCGNPDCDATGTKPSPMYRVYTGKNQNRVPWYRCTGRGPQRKGCGFMRRCDELDATVLELMLADDGTEHYERVFIPGDDRSDEIGRLRESAMSAYRKGDKAQFLELDAQADELASLPLVAPRWENKPTGRTEALYFALLDTDARRQELARRWAVVASRDTLTIGPKQWVPA